MPSLDQPSVTSKPSQPAVRLGLRANLAQFSLLVLINAFVGGMVGLERSVVPLLGQRQFGLASATAVLSFIMSFGVIVQVVMAETLPGRPHTQTQTN